MSLFYPFYAAKDFDKKKPLIMYGYGMLGIGFLRGMLAEGINVIGIFDANEEYHNTEIRGIPIMSPDKIKDFDRDVNVLISTMGYKYSITKLFWGLGFQNLYYEYYPEEEMEEEVRYEKRGEYDAFCSQREELIAAARALFKEEKSLKTFDAYFNAHRYGSWEEYESCMSRADWKNDGIFTFDENGTEVYYDCGAYDGGTAAAFHWMMLGREKWIYAFEPDELNCYAIGRKFGFEKLDKCSAHRYAICDKDGTVYFDRPENVRVADGMKIRECTEDTEAVPAITLDTFADTHYPPTMIHMDIEGAELSAVRGAEKIIKTCLPKLDISVYHKFEDVYEIPLEIEKIVPGKYDFYLRLTRSFYDLQLLAVPKH